MITTPYKDAIKWELVTRFGELGVKVQVAVDRELSKEEMSRLNDFAEQIQDLVMTGTVQASPEEMALAAQEKESLLAIFPQPIYVEAIPNGYCPKWCCKHKPWFIVTTAKGRFTIGWRKRVIEISWEAPVGGLAMEVFPNEDVTRSGRSIHAWGLEKAKEYVATLLEGKVRP